MIKRLTAILADADKAHYRKLNCYHRATNLRLVFNWAWVSSLVIVGGIERTDGGTMPQVDRWKGRKWKDILTEVREAQRLYDVTSELIDELAGFEKYTLMLLKVFEHQSSKHNAAIGRLRLLKRDLRVHLLAAYKMRRKYETVVADFRHQFGEFDHARTPNLADKGGLFATLAENYSTREIVEDFFDE